MQEATLAAFVSLGTLRDPARSRSWFYGTVVNVARAWRRRQASRPVLLDDWDAVRLIADPVDEAAQRELHGEGGLPPLAGALLKNEQDLQLLERQAFMRRRRS